MPDTLEVGAYEAKTQLPALLRKVRSGMRFTITQRGQPVADLIPTGAEARGLGAAAAGRMRQFMAKGGATTLTTVSAADIKALAADGRD